MGREGCIDIGVTVAEYIISMLAVQSLNRCLLRNNCCTVPGFVISALHNTVAANSLINSTIGAAATSPIVSLSNSKQHKQFDLHIISLSLANKTAALRGIAFNCLVRKLQTLISYHNSS